jgi:hypothetical protein
MALTTTIALNTNDLDTVGVTVFALVTATTFLSGEFLAVRAGNAYAGLGGGLCHRKPKLPPILKGQHTFRAVSVHFGIRRSNDLGCISSAMLCLCSTLRTLSLNSV